MLEAVDWVNDREWARLIYLRTDPAAARKIAKFSFPHFRTPKVIASFSSDDD